MNRKKIAAAVSEYALKAVSVCLVGMFFIVLGTMLILLASSNVTLNGLNEVFVGQQRYTMIDNFYDADDFYSFRQNAANINRLGSFYNHLMESDHINLLSVFDQPVVINEFRGTKKFYYNSDEFINEHKEAQIGIRSVQMNRNAFDFYGLQVKEGQQFGWNHIEYKEGELPVILGAGYQGIYECGDRITGKLYSEDFVFTVCGILKEDSFLYYKHNPEFYLDDYILIPYPEHAWEVDYKNFQFEGILYFALINCDLVTYESERVFLEEIKSIANASGFSDFSIVGIDDFQIQYQPLIAVLKENQKILAAMFLIMYVLLLFILFGLGQMLFYHNLLSYQIQWRIGSKKYKYLFYKDITLIYAAAFIAAILTECYLFQRVYIRIILIQGLILASIWFVICCLCNKFLLNHVLEERGTI